MVALVVAPCSAGLIYQANPQSRLWACFTVAFTLHQNCSDTFPALRLQNVVVYAGDQADRALIRRHEFWFSAATKVRQEYRFNVLLTSYEMLLKDKAVLKNIQWETAILDEAHRMKVCHACTAALPGHLGFGVIIYICQS